MSEPQQIYKPGADAEEEISLRELILKMREWYRYLLTKWKLIVLAGLIGGGIGLGYALIKKPVYKGVVTFVLDEEQKGGGLGGYAGLAAQFGLDLGGGAGGLFAGDNIMELMKSRNLVQRTLLTPVHFEKFNGLLIDRYIDFNHLRKGWVKKLGASSLDFRRPPATFTRVQDSLIGVVYNNILKNNLSIDKTDKKLNIITASISSQDEMFSKLFVEKLVENTSKFYIDTKTHKSRENLEILQHQTDSVRNELYQSMYGVASFQDLNQNLILQRPRVQAQKNQVNVQISSAVLQELIKNLEVAKVTLRKETPLIQVIDGPVLPLLKETIGEKKGFFFGLVLFSILSIIVILLYKIYINVIS